VLFEPPCRGVVRLDTDGAFALAQFFAPLPVSGRFRLSSSE